MNRLACRICFWLKGSMNNGWFVVPQHDLCLYIINSSLCFLKLLSWLKRKWINKMNVGFESSTISTKHASAVGFIMNLAACQKQINSCTWLLSVTATLQSQVTGSLCCLSRGTNATKALTTRLECLSADRNRTIVTLISVQSLIIS